MNIRRALLGLVAVLAVATTACGVGTVTDKDKIARSTSAYLHALADRDKATACAQLTEAAQTGGCRLLRLDADVLRRAADSSLDIGVHGRTAVATLGEPHGARLTFVKVGAAWRIRSGYGVVAPTGLVDIGGGLGLYLHCTGMGGTPTVVLEAGFGGDSDVWRDVQGQLGHTTRTCAYDRAGLGRSVARPGVHDARDELADLQQLLRAAGIAPPYVLVGHSYGGLLARLYAYAHPAETAGVVLVDAMGREQRRRELAAWPRRVAPAQRRAFANPVQAGVDVAATDALSRRVRTLGDTPLAVVTAGRHAQEFAPLPGPVARAVSRLWMPMQDELAGLSSDHVHVVALRSDHFVQRLDGQPGVVVAAVRAVVGAAFTHGRLPACARLFRGPGVRCR